MKRIKVLLCLLIIGLLTFGQKVDTVINNDVLTSHFSYKTHTPLFVVYTLYHGGGDCSRTAMVFETGDIKNSATENDYYKSGYDKGHLCNAEDFSYDCDKELNTFFYYNALPQKPNLNRGCWKKIETKVRNQSQDDSLLIICGGFGFSNKIGNTSVPDYCFKIIKNLKTFKIESYLFTNTDKSTYDEIEINHLLDNIPFANNIKKILNLK